jgi:hypothetical protein
MYQNFYFCPRDAEGPWKRTLCLPEDTATKEKRQIVYQNFYLCPRDVEDPWKRTPYLAEDTATKEKRQLVYQNHYFCPPSINSEWKRIPCLPEDTAAAATSKEKRFAEAAVAAEAKMAEWEAEWKP